MENSEQNSYERLFKIFTNLKQLNAGKDDKVSQADLTQLLQAYHTLRARGVFEDTDLSLFRLADFLAEMISCFIRSLERDKDSWLHLEAKKLRRRLESIVLAEGKLAVSICYNKGDENRMVFSVARRKRKIRLNYRDLFFTESGRLGIFIGLRSANGTPVKGARDLFYLRQGDESPTYYAYVPELPDFIKKVNSELLKG